MAKTSKKFSRNEYDLLGAKNLIINGALDFWQRGTNVNAQSAYGPDRFFGNSASGFFSRVDTNDAFTGASLKAIGFEYAVNAEQTVGGGVIAQRVEAKFLRDELNVGDKAVFSFYATSATANATGVSISLLIPDAEDNHSSTTRLVLNAGGNNVSYAPLGSLRDRSVGFDRFNYVFTITQDMLDRGLGIEIGGDFENGDGLLAGTFVVTGVMLHKGAEVIPFKRAGNNYAEELQLCQRYFEKTFGLDVRPNNGGATTFVDSNRVTRGILSNAGGWNVPFLVEKRIIPTMARYGNSSAFWLYWVNNTTTAFSSAINITASSTRNATVSQQAVSSVASFEGHWTADAEL